jgi:5'-3' exonuclease
MSGDPEKTLLLVDGSSYLYRAFHALPELRSPKTGEPTGAIYGVLNMLRKLATDYKAQARACVFDARGKTFRDEVYPDYKATRSAMPDDLSRQVEPLHEAVAALGWPVLSVPGVEADDVIATLAEEAKRRGWQTVISTGDKDLTQLVDERTLWINTMSNEKLDVAGVTAKFGVAPDKIVDYLALVGDAIDNVPGVHGVGPGFAAKWIKQYGSLDNLMAKAGEITGTRGENLRKVLDWLPKARELLTVKRDVPLPFAFEKLTEFEPKPELQRSRRTGSGPGGRQARNPDDSVRCRAARPRAQAGSGRHRRLRGDGIERGADERDAGRPRIRVRGRSGLPAARPRLSGRAGAARCPEGSPNLAGTRRLQEGGREREARLAPPRQPRHRARRLRARRPARVLRARGPRAPRSRLAGAAPLRLDDAPV